jgi:hypothetical protein
MTVYKSGAFLQQCFSVHPLSLDVKLVTLPEIAGVSCRNCRMRHRLTIRQVTGPQAEQAESSQLHLLQGCVHGHPEEIRIISVQIDQHTVEFRCRPCRRTYVLDVALFESHQA